MNLKKILSSLTAAACSMSLITLMPESLADTYAAEVVSNDFEVTYEGWHSTATDGNIIAEEGIGVDGSRAMTVTDRATPADGASSSKGFYLEGGVAYDYNVKVFSKTDETFRLTLKTLDNDTEEETVVELCSKKVKAGKWTEISVNHTAPKNSYEFELTITTDSTNDFSFDDVSITTEAKKIITASAVDGNGLKDVFKGYGFRVGNILNRGTIQNSSITANFLKDYNAVECENETKPDATLVQSGSTNTDVKVSLNSCAAIADFAEKNGLGFRGHTFVWHSQTPNWFFKEGFSDSGATVSVSTMDQRIDSYIKNMFAAFKKQYPSLNLYSYDVCNECMNDSNGGPRTAGINGGQNGTSGYVAVYGNNSFIEKAFRSAKKYAPEGCDLYYNDYNEYMANGKKQAIMALAKELYGKGLLDGVGMQSHVPANATGFAGTVDYLQAMDDYLAIGCDVQVTELDVSINSGEGQSLQTQTDKYKAIVQHIVDVNKSGKYNGKVTLFQVWGPNDANTWISGDKSPTLYDKNNQPKQAYTTLMTYGKSLPEGPFKGFGEPLPDPEPDADGIWFHHKFEGSDEGWEGRGAASVQTSGRVAYADKEALLVQDREAEWNGAIFTLPRGFKAGEEYSFSTNVTYFDGGDTRDFKLTLEYYDPNMENDEGGKGRTTWAEIASGTTAPGQWLQLANTNFKIPADASDLKIIVETTDGTLDNFYIDEAIGAVAGKKIDGAGQPHIAKLIRGDVDCDGVIDSIDLAFARRGLFKGFKTEIAEKAADVDQSTTVEINDIVLLQSYILGRITEFPINKPPVASVDVQKMQSLFAGVTNATSLKESGKNYPLYTQRFGADPGFMVYKDRLYVYTTNDAFEYNGNSMKENSYDVGTINCCSSADLVNWTDHGAIPVAGRNGRTQGGVAKWASCSWAPDACWKTINGKDKFFLYFANSGGGIGVLTADSPTGPWTDPLGHALLSGSSPNCSDVVWMFDPGVMVDDDGTGYLYFGGGVDNRDKANPKTGRCVKLGDDMISLAGTPVTMETPYLFEDSSILKIGDTYYYSYCANWNVPGNTSYNGQSFNSADICYLTSKNPLGPWTSQQFGGMVFKNTGSQGLDNGGNNHHSIVYFKNKYYVLYHTRKTEMLMGVNGGKGYNYRSPSINEATLSNGKITCKGDHNGVAQVEKLDPYEVVQAETMFNQSKGISVNGLMDTTVKGSKGDWIAVKGADFSNGTYSIKMKGKGGAVKICAGGPDGSVIGYVELPSSNSEEVEFATTANVTGSKDVYFVFGGDVELDYWQFS